MSVTRNHPVSSNPCRQSIVDELLAEANRRLKSSHGIDADMLSRLDEATARTARVSRYRLRMSAWCLRAVSAYLDGQPEWHDYMPINCEEMVR